MIFLTVGTHPQQFNRLVREVDRLVGKKIIEEKVFAQIGHSTYLPKNIEYVKFLPLYAFHEKMRDASLIITHAGEGNVGRGMQLGKKMVIVPRLKRFGEHTNDHQLELARAIEGKGAAIAVYDVKDVGAALGKAAKFRPKKREMGKGIIQLIEEFLEREKID